MTHIPLLCHFSGRPFYSESSNPISDMTLPAVCARPPSSNCRPWRKVKEEKASFFVLKKTLKIKRFLRRSRVAAVPNLADRYIFNYALSVLEHCSPSCDRGVPSWSHFPPFLPPGPIFQSHKLWLGTIRVFPQSVILPLQNLHGNPSNSLGTADFICITGTGRRKEAEVFFSQTFMI